ncbi:hypothetical protein [Lysobacter humi (ex Lee et al. 2017)]
MPLPFYLSFAGLIAFVISTRLMRRGAAQSRNVTSIWRGGAAVAKAGLLLWWAAIVLVLAGVLLLVL